MKQTQELLTKHLIVNQSDGLYIRDGSYCEEWFPNTPT